VASGRHWRPSEWSTPAKVTVAVTVVLGLLGIGRDLFDVKIGEPPAAAAPTGAPQPPGPSLAPVVQTPEARHRGRISLEPGQSANLDAPQSSLDWTFNDGSPDEIRYSPDTGLRMGSGEIVTLERTEADYASCLSATGYARRSFDRPDLIVGDYFCVKTSENRIATFQLIGARNDLFTVDVITYEPQL
jgi:hypothetical protein